MIVFIADIMHQALTEIPCSHARKVCCSEISIGSIYGFGTQLPTETQKIIAWLLANDKFTCLRNIHMVSSNFPS
jgi:hypothetical protein